MQSRHFARGLKVFAFVLALVALISSQNALAATAKATLPPIEGYDSEHPETLTADHLYALSAILIEEDSGRVLFEKDANRKLSPASTTKVMTLMLALEYGHLDEYITIPDEAADIPKDSSVIPVKPGEQMTYIDLLYGFMMQSGNDGANSIAVIVAGSVDAFVDMMNQRAQELGCTNTHFSNPHGYTDEEHYTSARDMAVIARAAMQDETFRKIVGTGSYLMDATNMRGGLTVTNTNLFATGTSKYRYEYGTGIKTGFTNDAGHCLVGSATDDRGVKLISVVFNSTNTNSEAKWLDTTRLMEYGLTRYDQYSFSQIYEMAPLTVAIQNAKDDDPAGGQLTMNAMLNRSNNYYALCFDQDIQQMIDETMSAIQVEYSHSLEAPIEAGTIMGTLTYAPPSGGEAVTAVLIADRSIEAAPASMSLYNMSLLLSSVPGWMIGVAITLLVVLVLMSWAQAAANRRKRRRRAQASRRRR